MKSQNVQSIYTLEISQILNEDSNFFKITSLMDYSLLILKVDWKSYTLDSGKTPEDLISLLPSQYSLIKSTKEEGVSLFSYHRCGIRWR